MRSRLSICLAALLLIIAACQTTPPTAIYIIISPTPDENAASSLTEEITTAQPTDIPPTNTPAPTPTLDPFPTPTIGQVQVAEQVFERGRMFWMQPTRQIWVMIAADDTKTHGDWLIYEDTFQDGEMEFDPSIVPEEGFFQPERGFGKLWRENESVRDALGWAITDEFGYISRYEYHPGGDVNRQNIYEPGPGYHILYSLYEEPFRFNEEDQTWQRGRGDD